jgi:hypothetical protein
MNKAISIRGRLNILVCSLKTMIRPVSQLSTLNNCKYQDGNFASFYLAYRRYHNSVQLNFAKGSKKGAKVQTEEEANDIYIPSAEDTEKLMDKKISRLQEEFTKFRGGRASPDIFNGLMVEAYGSKVPLSETGQITMKGTNKVCVALYDAELAVPASNAIRDCGLSLNPTVEGNSILVVIPKPSKEARENVIKLASKTAEKVSKA